MSVDVEIDTEEFDEMINKEMKLVDRIRETQLPIFAFDVIATARSNLQNNQSVVSGELNASIGMLAEDSDSITVGSEAPQAQWVEYGRGPVRAKNKKYLHFFTKDGREIFTKEVGPAAPRPFFEPAVLEALKRFQKALKQALE